MDLFSKNINKKFNMRNLCFLFLINIFFFITFVLSQNYLPFVFFLVTVYFIFLYENKGVFKKENYSNLHLKRNDFLTETLTNILNKTTIENYHEKIIIFLKDHVLKNNNIAFVSYDLSSCIYKIETSYGYFANSRLLNNPIFSDIIFKPKSIPKSKFHLFFQIENSKELLNLKNFGIIPFRSNKNYLGFILFEVKNPKEIYQWFTEHKPIFSIIETSFKLHHSNKEILLKDNYLRALKHSILSMEKKRNLKELVYSFLTHTTANDGLKFNRAILFFNDRDNKSLRGYQGIGPLTYKEADANWNKIKACPIELFDNKSSTPIEPLQKIVESSSLSYSSKDDLDRFIYSSQKYLIIDMKSSDISSKNYKVFKKLNLNRFLIIKMESQKNLIGLLAVDNAFDKRIFSANRIDSLLDFSLQTSLVLNNLEMYKKIEEFAIKDSLTKLHNRRYFDTCLHLEEKRVTRSGNPLSLIMIDIDYFKIYNDTNGHIEGDKLLEQIAEIFSDSVRETDFVCRYGGEEFSIILPNTDKLGAYHLAEKIRDKVYHTNFQFGHLQPNNRVSISLGVASYPETTKILSDLKSIADKALYLSKKTGRNKVSL